jgi:hypothetical protein
VARDPWLPRSGNLAPVATAPSIGGRYRDGCLNEGGLRRNQGRPWLAAFHLSDSTVRIERLLSWFESWAFFFAVTKKLTIGTQHQVDRAGGH